MTDHSNHEKLAHCEECGRQICLCLALCEPCRNSLDLEAEEEGQRWADAREAGNGGRYF